MPAKRAFVYILKCADGTFYIGTAKNVAKRLGQHNARKGAKYTKPRRPVRVDAGDEAGLRFRSYVPAE